jgi:IS4 transposase
VEHKRTSTYLTNNFGISAKYVALLYKNRWQVELFFKWIKQHLHIKSFWRVTENAVRCQIYATITAYCLVAIIEHGAKLSRRATDVLKVNSTSIFDKTPNIVLFEKPESVDDIIEFRVIQLFFLVDTDEQMGSFKKLSH